MTDAAGGAGEPPSPGPPPPPDPPRERMRLPLSLRWANAERAVFDPGASSPGGPTGLSIARELWDGLGRPEALEVVVVC